MGLIFYYLKQRWRTIIRRVRKIAEATATFVVSARSHATTRFAPDSFS